MSNFPWSKGKKSTQSRIWLRPLVDIEQESSLVSLLGVMPGRGMVTLPNVLDDNNRLDTILTQQAFLLAHCSRYQY